MEGLYCGKQDCYDVLGVTRDSSKYEISKAYRALAKKHHPDRHRDEKEKAEASEMFKTIANAYEILKDDEARTDYDYMLDHPEEYYRHYYHYYRHRMAPKVDIRIVVAVTITVISAFQYYAAMFRWSSGVRYLAAQPKYRSMAMSYAEENGMLDNLRKIKKRNKEDIKAEEERIIKQVLEENIDIRGGYAKPRVSDVLWIQLLMSPYTIYLYFAWQVKWFWRFTIKKEEYGTEEKLYLIRRYLGISSTQFEALSDAERKEFLDEELWIKENFVAWKDAKEEERKRQLAESARYKSYRRYMKKHGPGRMYFDD
ncbi:DnaJ subfamily C member 25 [Orchesella cincta]|uniref:DnaJ subfamily C member 25 n=1 Tax=Orchesella cincta TaxID=48709 RepID=A0A1D2MUF3_ORCCI|nr:DnaJ subfamily C member 25 [Orchesella cincta]